MCCGLRNDKNQPLNAVVGCDSRMRAIRSERKSATQPFSPEQKGGTTLVFHAPESNTRVVHPFAPGAPHSLWEQRQQDKYKKCAFAPGAKEHINRLNSRGPGADGNNFKTKLKTPVKTVVNTQQHMKTYNPYNNIINVRSGGRDYIIITKRNIINTLKQL